MPRCWPGEEGHGPNLPVSSLLHRILNVAFEIHNIILHSSPCKLTHSSLFTPGRYLKVCEKPENSVEGLVSAAMPPQTNETLLAQRCFSWRGRRGEAVSRAVVTSSLLEAAGRPRGPLWLSGNALPCFSCWIGAALMSKHVPLVPPAALQSLSMLRG